MTTRREFVTLLGGAAAAWPLAAKAQQPERMRRIGIILPAAADDAEFQARVGAFLQALALLGWTIGRNVRIDTRWATANAAEIRKHAAELAALAPEVILAHGTSTVGPLLAATRTVPIVFPVAADPVGAGFVESLARPGGNVTGFSYLEGSMAGKWLEFLKEIAPRVSRAGVLFNPATAPFAEYYLNPFKAAAASIGVQAVAVPVRGKSDLESVVATQAQDPNSGLIVMPEPFNSARRAEITALAARHRLPAIYPFRFYAELGGLLSYGNDPVDNCRRAAAYVDRVLKGAKPSELPVQFPVKFELVINMKTAKALGLDVPWQLQQLADEVIE